MRKAGDVCFAEVYWDGDGMSSNYVQLLFSCYIIIPICFSFYICWISTFLKL